MHPADIQNALKKHGITQKNIANHFDVSETWVSFIINKKAPSPSEAIMRYISEQIGKEPYEVFPEHFLSKRPERRVA